MTQRSDRPDFLWRPPRPTVPVKTGALILALGRAQLTREQWNSEVDKVKLDYIAGSIERAAHTFLIWNWLSLWLGCLAVVAEGFETGYEHDHRLLDAVITELLHSPHQKELKRYRNKIFHPEPYDHDHVIRVLKALDTFIPWAENLHDEFVRFFQGYLSN